MTNLTDEGLMELALGIIPDSLLVETGFKNTFLLIRRHIYDNLKQVRDAAKKEERERCAKVAEAECHGLGDMACDHGHEIAEAIRQME